MAKFDLSRQNPLVIAAAVAAVALGVYASFNLILPALFAAAAWLALRNLAPSAKQPALPALAWQAGQLGWFVLGLVFGPQALMQIGPDILILGGLMIWFYLSLNRFAAWALIAYQGLSVAVNGWAFVHAPITSPTDRALAVHIVWRVVAIALTVQFIRRPAAPAAADKALD